MADQWTGIIVMPVVDTAVHNHDVGIWVGIVQLSACNDAVSYQYGADALEHSSQEILAQLFVVDHKNLHV
jgi:hypothetical protein